jgi:hypothetical protein
MAALDIALEAVAKLKAKGLKAGLISAEITTKVYAFREDGAMFGQGVSDKSTAEDIVAKIEERLKGP